MQGQLVPSTQNALYRGVYTTQCQALRAETGLRTLPLNSYDSIPPYFFALDTGLVPLPGDAPVPCCRLVKLPPAATATHAAVRRYGAFLTVLFAQLKLTDDVRDDGASLARLGLHLLRSAIAKTDAFFSGLDPDFPARIDAILGEQARLEARPGRVSLDEAVGPTARGYGYVYSLLARCLDEPRHAEPLRRLGELLGAATIAVDAAVDFEDDRVRARFTPLASRAEAAGALDFARSRLLAAASLAEETFGRTDTHTAALLRAVETSLFLDATGRPAVAASRLAPDLERECTPAGTPALAALGMGPAVSLADGSQNGDGCGPGLLALGCGAFVFNQCCKAMGCQFRKVRRDSRGNETVTMVGPLGC